MAAQFSTVFSDLLMYNFLYEMFENIFDDCGHVTYDLASLNRSNSFISDPVFMENTVHSLDTFCTIGWYKDICLRLKTFPQI